MRTAVYLLNRSPTQALTTTPYEALLKKKPNLSKIHVSGCNAYVYDKSRKTAKLEDRSWKGIFLGYEASNQNRVYNPVDKLVYIRRDVRFDDTTTQRATPQGAYKEAESDDKDEEYPWQRTSPGLVEEQECMDLPAQGDSNENQGPLGNREDTVPRQEDEEDIEDTIILAPAQPPAQEPTPRRSGRDTRRPDYAELNAGCQTRHKARVAKTTKEFTPMTYQQAITCADAKKWIEAMNVDNGALRENKTWKLKRPPQDRKILGGKWVYKIKTLPDGGKKYKARWVIKGYEQVEGLDYDETFASVVRTATTNLLYALAAREGWHDEQMDVVTAFLNGQIKEIVYMEQPTGFEGIKGLVCLLQKTLYGLKQAPRV